MEIVNSQGGPMRHLRTVFCSLAVLVLVGIGTVVDAADTLPNATTEAWNETRKLCLQMQMPSSSLCEAIIDALSGKGKPFSLPSSGDTLTDAITEAILQSVGQDLIWSNSRDPDVVGSKLSTRAMFHACSEKGNVDNCEKIEAQRNVRFARIKARAKAAIGDKKRFRHCKKSLAPVDDPKGIVKCLEELDAILASCGTKMPCVTDNITAYSALLVYTVKSDNKDRDAAFVARCQEQYQNLSGWGYREIWACVQGYLGLLKEAPDRTDGN